MNVANATLKLNDGRSSPQVGLGVWQTPSGASTREAVAQALAAGYRHVDTARIYNNETDVGAAIAQAAVPRAELFVTTKLWNADHGYDRALRVPVTVQGLTLGASARAYRFDAAHSFAANGSVAVAANALAPVVPAQTPMLLVVPLQATAAPTGVPASWPARVDGGGFVLDFASALRLSLQRLFSWHGTGGPPEPILLAS